MATFSFFGRTAPRASRASQAAAMLSPPPPTTGGALVADTAGSSLPTFVLSARRPKRPRQAIIAAIMLVFFAHTRSRMRCTRAGLFSA